MRVIFNSVSALDTAQCSFNVLMLCNEVQLETLKCQGILGVCTQKGGLGNTNTGGWCFHLASRQDDEATPADYLYHHSTDGAHFAPVLIAKVRILIMGLIKVITLGGSSAVLLNILIN